MPTNLLHHGPLKQGPKKWSKHGCDKGTLTVNGLGTHKEKKRMPDGLLYVISGILAGGSWFPHSAVLLHSLDGVAM